MLIANRSFFLLSFRGFARHDDPQIGGPQHCRPTRTVIWSLPVRLGRFEQAEFPPPGSVGHVRRPAVALDLFRG